MVINSESNSTGSVTGYVHLHFSIVFLSKIELRFVKHSVGRSFKVFGREVGLRSEIV